MRCCDHFDSAGSATFPEEPEARGNEFSIQSWRTGMATADSRRFTHKEDPAESTPAPRRFRASRWSAIHDWVGEHRRESAAAIVALMMIVLMFDAPPPTSAVRSTQPTDMDAIDDLFAEIDAARARTPAKTETDQTQQIQHLSGDAGADVQKTVGWQGEAAPILRIPGEMKSQPSELPARPEQGANAESSGGIRFSGLLRPAE